MDNPIVNIKIMGRGLWHREQKTCQKAYSLLELCLIFFIIALSGFLILPYFSSSNMTYNLRTEAQQLAMIVQEAQKMAETTQIRHRVILTRMNGFYTVQKDLTEVKRVNLKQGITIDSTTFIVAGTDILEFNKFGVPSEGGQIVLREASGQTKTIEVTPTTGRTTVWTW